MKTQNEIATSIYTYVSTYLTGKISGLTYKNVRPSDSKLEDCVINVIPGIIGKHTQNGAVVIKIYFDDIFQKNSYFENTKRGQEVETYLMTISDELLMQKIVSFEIDSRQISIGDANNTFDISGFSNKGDNLHQHYGILKINYTF